MSFATRPGALWALVLVAFAESSFFPIPPVALLIPMVLADRNKAWFFAAICTLASVIGGAAGYLIGWGLFETIGQPILSFYGLTDKFESFAVRYNDYGAWIVFFAGVTPFPYKVITIASGVTGLNFWIFTIASILARGLQYFFIAGLLYWIGAPIRTFIERRLGLVAILFFVTLFAGFFLVKYLH
ncbi:MAG: DedA family protein [Fimbriimonadaceae bacterium]|nr:DedA family protein [Alphaproteobacteria bacterium]